MIRRQGAKLLAAVSSDEGNEFLTSAIELRAADDADPLLPVILQVDSARPHGEEWPQFKDRVEQTLGEAINDLNREVQPPFVEPLFSGNSLATALTREQYRIVAEMPGIVLEYADLDNVEFVTSMIDVPGEIGLDAFCEPGSLTGEGVTVAVLDSGIDREHPSLTVTHQESTCDEMAGVPGAHGTHCAGIVASQDRRVRGVAPGVTLADVKVLRSNGSGRSTFVLAGIDRALDLGAQVLSMSLGFNHLPRELGGNGWECPDSTCPMCLAVDNATDGGATVVVAAGNEHLKCQQLRAGGMGLRYDTELGCPGQASKAVTVAAHHKATFAPAAFSSSGPSAGGNSKPDIAAPGVNITSTIPLPRDLSGNPMPRTSPEQRFAAMSGTSMATPIVAGTCALLIERARNAGQPADPASIRAALVSLVQDVGGPINVLGPGRLRLA